MYQSNSPRVRTRNAISLLLCLSSAFLFTGCEPEHVREQEKYILPVSHPTRLDIELPREFVAQIRSSQHIELRALERGYLQEIFVDEGQAIKKGQLMFRLMPALYQAELRKTEAETEFARIEFENTRSLADKNVVSTNELALAKAKLEKAQAELSLAKTHLSFTEIRAPFDGIMDRFHVRLGSLVEEGELLTTLSDNTRMWAYFNVNEVDYLAFREAYPEGIQLPVFLKLANGTVFDEPGIIETIEADFNNETGNIAFRATFPNPDGLLRHGGTGKIRINFPVPDALVIPQKATFDILDKKFVYLVDGHETVHTREIEVSAELPHLFVVKSGLTEDDAVLLDGLRRVREGDEIEAEIIEPEAALAQLDDLRAE